MALIKLKTGATRTVDQQTADTLVKKGLAVVVKETTSDTTKSYYKKG